MTLGELIEELEKLSPDRVLPLGFDKPHSYRGYYNELAFEPARNIPVRKMLEAAREALGNSYEGYKGGTYYMDAGTECWISEYGTTGEQLGSLLWELLIGQANHETVELACPDHGVIAELPDNEDLINEYEQAHWRELHTLTVTRPPISPPSTHTSESSPPNVEGGEQTQ